MSPVTELPPAHVVDVARPGYSLTAQAAGWTTYVVRSGDTLWDIAGRTGTTVGELVARNGLSSAGVVLRAGDRLSVPSGGPSVARPAPGGAASAAGTYVVRAGDSVWDIATSLGVRVDALLAANSLAMNSTILPGQRLSIPAGVSGSSTADRTATKAARTSAADTGATSVTVRSGDTLWGIASRYGVSMTSLAKANGINLDTTIRPGDRLTIAGSVASSAASTTSTGPLATSAGANLAYLNGVATPNRTQIRSMIVSTAQAHGVDPRLALAVGWQESRWNQKAVSEANAIGVMQCLPSTGRWVSELVGRPLDLLNTQDNITCGVVLLRSLTRSTSSEAEALAAYYQGLTSVRQRGLFADTKDYVASVQAYKAQM
ncbi:MAG: LysM peptidoglycan-binding domain-containing protein [Austwickia sp.]|nr:LysM peptidoglycan-binding domain-containing protein [Austwickia sp.]